MLFTLLVVIYINAGSAAAKRHRIYQLAVQTLVAIRSRDASQRVFSEQDLRARLGAVALATLRDSALAVPGWRAAQETIREVVAAERGVPLESVSLDEIATFLQVLGEATGIVVPDPSPDDSRGGSLVFMHQSFFEYYAAAGLLLEHAWPEKAAAISEVPRWREVLLLLAGLAGEQSNSVLLLQAILKHGSQREVITLRALQTCFDCALEVEVPSENVHRFLIAKLVDATPLALRFDAELRARFGRNLATLYRASRSELVIDYLRRLLAAGSTDLPTGIELVAHVGNHVDLPQDLYEAVWNLVEHGDADVHRAACAAVTVCPRMHIARHRQRLLPAFSGSINLRLFATQAARHWPELAVAAWPELLSEMQPAPIGYHGVAAANAVLRAGWYVSVADEDRASNALAALKCLLEKGSADDVEGLGHSLEFDEVRQLRTASGRTARYLATALLPWVRGSDFEVYQWLLQIVSSGTDHEEVAIGLGALTLSRSSRDLLRIGDKDNIVSRLDDRYRDVRIAAARLLGELEYDAHCVEALMRYVRRQDTNSREHEAGLESLLRFLDRPRIQAFVEDEFSSYVARTRRTPETLDRLRSCLAALQGVSQPCSGATSRILRDLIDGHGWSSNVRALALIALGAAAEPDDQSMQLLLKRLRGSAGVSSGSAYEAIALFLERCQENLEYLTRITPHLREAEAELVRHAMNIAAVEGADVQSEFRQLRRSLDAIGAIQAVQTEFGGLAAAIS